MDPISSFPHLNPTEFTTACTTLLKSHTSLSDTSQRSPWLSIELLSSFGDKFLRISKPLTSPKKVGEQQDQRHSEDGSHESNEEDDSSATEEEIQEPLDPEALSRATPTPLIHYDIHLSPTYLVPVLYFHIHAPQPHLYPPTLHTLHTELLTPSYLPQTQDPAITGPLGGVTVTEHPVLGRPVFFVHPCRTGDVMGASVGGGGVGGKVTPVEYLVMWIGAMGKGVGLDVPLGVAVECAKQGKSA